MISNETDSKEVTYTDINNDKKALTKKDINKMFFYSLTMEYSWHYERQMHMGFAFMMMPILKKLYGNDKQKMSEALTRHMEFFNCTAHISTFIGGIVAAMEEMNSNQENFDTKSINSIKAALMGPLSGIGDSIMLGTLRILGVGIGSSLAMKGSILGPILFLLVFNIPAFIIRYFGAIKGYELGAKYLDKIQKSGLMEKFMYAAGILGVMVIGGMTNELVIVKTPLSIGVGENITYIQEILDSIMPGILSLIVMFTYYWLLNKKINVVWLILFTAVLGIVCAQFRILG